MGIVYDFGNYYEIEKCLNGEFAQFYCQIKFASLIFVPTFIFF